MRPQFTGYSYPWEFYHSSIYGDGVPSYWVRQKVGAMPGYTSMITLFPEIKTSTPLINALCYYDWVPSPLHKYVQSIHPADKWSYPQKHLRCGGHNAYSHGGDLVGSSTKTCQPWQLDKFFWHLHCLCSLWVILVHPSISNQILIFA